MENLNMFLYISIAFPLVAVAVVASDQIRGAALFLIFGLSAALFCGELNGYLKALTDFPIQYYSTNISPIVEELVKAFPLIIYAFSVHSRRKRLIEYSICTGVGFAILENAFVFASNIMSVSLPLALVRGLGTGLMHAVCAMAIGFGLSFIEREKNVAILGTLGLLGAVTVYHSIYNKLILSEYAMFAIVFPLLSIIPFVVIIKLREREQKHNNLEKIKI